MTLRFLSGDRQRGKTGGERDKCCVARRCGFDRDNSFPAFSAWKWRSRAVRRLIDMRLHFDRSLETERRKERPQWLRESKSSTCWLEWEKYLIRLLIYEYK